jgi:hypothetical protein
MSSSAALPYRAQRIRRSTSPWGRLYSRTSSKRRNSSVEKLGMVRRRNYQSARIIFLEELKECVRYPSYPPYVIRLRPFGTKSIEFFKEIARCSIESYGVTRITGTQIRLPPPVVPFTTEELFHSNFKFHLAGLENHIAENFIHLIEHCPASNQRDHS